MNELINPEYILTFKGLGGFAPSLLAVACLIYIADRVMYFIKRNSGAVYRRTWGRRVNRKADEKMQQERERCVREAEEKQNRLTFN